MKSEKIMNVGDIEALFLSGNFRQALFHSNQVLVDGSKVESHNASEQDRVDSDSLEIPLETPLCLNIDAAHHDRRLIIQLPARKKPRDMKEHKDESFDDVDGECSISDMDRAATIALQSWYEITRSIDTVGPGTLDSQNAKATKKRALRGETSRGHVHLLPFLDAYTTSTAVSKKSDSDNIVTTTRSMPLELAVIFARFLRTSTIGSMQECVALSSEILHRVVLMYGSLDENQSTTRTFIPRHVRECCEDLFSLVFVETLPYTSSRHVVTKIIERVSSDHHSNHWPSKGESFVILDTPKLNTVLTLLQFLDNIPQMWSQQSFPSQDCIQVCRSSLHRLVKVLELENQEQNTLGAAVSGSSNRKQQLRFAHKYEKLDTVENNAEDSPLSGLLTGSNKRNSGRTSASWLATLLRLSGDAQEWIEKFQDKKGALVFVLLIVMLAWRKRQRVTSVSSAALHLFLAPIREVVDAVLKPS